jgi:hypothetical protein
VTTTPSTIRTRRGLADTLGELSAAVRTYGSLATALHPRRHDALKAELERHLAAARDQQDRLSELLATAPAVRPVGWPLRGEVISHQETVPGAGRRRTGSECRPRFADS